MLSVLGGMRFRSRAGALAMLSVLGGCNFAPVYSVPDSGNKPDQYLENSDWKVAQPSDAEPRGNWWNVFDDPELDRLELQAGQANQNLKAAFARLRQARDDYRIARADLFPTLTGQASAMRGRESPNSPRFPVGAPTLSNDFVVGGDLSYELDLWGRVRDEVAAAKDTQQASSADLAALALSIQAEVATDYYGLRGLDRQQELLDKTVQDYEAALKLTRNLFEGGAAALTDVAQAEAQLDNARTQASENRLQRAQAEHAIAVLIGENPSNYRLAAMPMDAQAEPPAVAASLPSALLERRPDVAAAERRVAAANAQIGVARAAYFPQFELSAEAGFESRRVSGLISAPSRFWSFGPQVTLPIFEGGRLRAQTDRAKAAYEEQVATYRNTVLAAYQDVEDNLAALRQLKAAQQTQRSAVRATGTTVTQSQYRYKTGIVTYLEVSTSETAALQAQLSEVDIQMRRIDASVLLIKALGGGWRSPSPEP